MNGDVFIWGRPDFGRLGRSKRAGSSVPLLVESLWRSEMSKGRVSAALDKVPGGWGGEVRRRGEEQAGQEDRGQGTRGAVEGRGEGRGYVGKEREQAR